MWKAVGTTKSHPVTGVNPLDSGSKHLLLGKERKGKKEKKNNQLSLWTLKTMFYLSEYFQVLSKTQIEFEDKAPNTT